MRSTSRQTTDVFVTAGIGLCQRRGGSIEIIRPGDRILIDLLGHNDSRANEQGDHVVALPPHGYRWYRPGGIERRMVP